MKKVGILSMQRIANYGSFLQAYGLMRMLEELGCEVQFVDYHPGKTLIPTDGGIGFKRKVFKAFETLKYDAPLKQKIKYIQYKKNYAANYYPHLGLGEMNFSPRLDVLVIGSDEVFNCVQNNTNVGFAPELFGVNSNAEKVITYAASFGNTTVEMLKEYCVEEEVASYLKKIDSISVRDKNSGSIVKELTGIEPIFHLDPVLAYDFIGKCTEIPASVPEENYMILYGYAGRFSKDECRHIRDYSKRKGVKIFCIGGVQDACDTFIACDPFRVIAYFQHADCVVTDTFHGTILSVITHKPFVSVVRSTGYGNCEKMTDLVERLGLTDRILNDFQNFSSKIHDSIDYERVDRVIAAERRRSIDYLTENIRPKDDDL